MYASRAGKNNVYLLLAFIAIAQQQGGTHTGLKVAQGAFCCMHVLLHQLLHIPQHMSAILDACVAQYNTWLLIKLLVKGVVFSFLVLFSSQMCQGTLQAGLLLHLPHTQACYTLVTHRFDSRYTPELQAT